MQEAALRAEAGERATARLAAGAEGVAAAARVLRAGGLAAFPTETVYGLGARADDGAAVAGIYAAKGRPAFNPLIVHVAGLEAADRLAVFSPLARRLGERLWPGALTLVLERRPRAALAEATTARLPTVAIRVPAALLALELLRAVGAPVAAPSANLSGRVSPTTAKHVLEELDGRIDAVLDGGPCLVGVESTIVRVLQNDAAPVLLRPGGVTPAEIEAACGVAPWMAGEGAGGPAPAAPGRASRPPTPARPGAAETFREAPDAVTAPGQLASHYAPGAALRLEAAEPAPDEAWLGFGAEPAGAADGGRPALNLSPSGDLGEAAASLFAHLRALDARMSGRGTIAVAPIPAEGLGLALRDRLARAAAPRTRSETER